MYDLFFTKVKLLEYNERQKTQVHTNLHVQRWLILKFLNFKK